MGPQSALARLCVLSQASFQRAHLLIGVAQCLRSGWAGEPHSPAHTGICVERAQGCPEFVDGPWPHKHPALWRHDFPGSRFVGRNYWKPCRQRLDQSEPERLRQGVGLAVQIRCRADARQIILPAEKSHPVGEAELVGSGTNLLLIRSF